MISLIHWRCSSLYPLSIACSTQCVPGVGFEFCRRETMHGPIAMPKRGAEGVLRIS